MNLPTLLLVALFALVVLRRAWVCDDAYITFRTVDNVVHGYGLTWNAGERVQTYTHPLWMLLLTVFYALTGEAFWTSIVLSLILSVVTLLLLVSLVARSTTSALFVSLLLVFSRAFVDYSTSGLENALTHLLLVLFGLFYLRPGFSLRRVFTLSLIASLGTLNRMDTVLLYLPALLYALWRARGEGRFWRVIGAAALGQLPFVLWEIFSLIYYGFTLPNTAFAKLATGISRWELIEQGWYYVLSSLEGDPLTLLAMLCALLLGFSLPEKKNVWIAGGLILYMMYVIGIGGDFASGRFFTAPLLCAAIVLSQYDFDRVPSRLVLLPFALVVVLGMVVPHPTLRVHDGSVADVMGEVFVDDRGIADERLWYYPSNALIRARREVSLPHHRWRADGIRLRVQGEPVVVLDSIGMAGYYAGPEVYIMDTWALADPLRARLPAYHNPNWRIGHFDRLVPEGYVRTLRTGHNYIADPDLAAYYDQLRLITRGALFSRERLAAIWNMNLGRYDHLIELDAYRYPNKVYVSLSQINEPKEPGTSIMDWGNVMFYDSGVEIDLEDVRHATQIELSLDSNDDYRVVYLGEEGELASQTVQAPYAPDGLAVHVLDVPPEAASAGYTKIRVLPLYGDDNYVLGHLLLR